LNEKDLNGILNGPLELFLSGTGGSGDGNVGVESHIAGAIEAGDIDLDVVGANEARKAVPSAEQLKNQSNKG